LYAGDSPPDRGRKLEFPGLDECWDGAELSKSLGHLPLLFARRAQALGCRAGRPREGRDDMVAAGPVEMVLDIDLVLRNGDRALVHDA
jgi:hypothetical protein